MIQQQKKIQEIGSTSFKEKINDLKQSYLQAGNKHTRPTSTVTIDLSSRIATTTLV